MTCQVKTIEKGVTTTKCGEKGKKIPVTIWHTDVTCRKCLALMVTALLAFAIFMAPVESAESATGTVKAATATATATRGGYLPPTDRWQIVLTFAAASSDKLGWPKATLSAPRIAQYEQVAIAAQLKSMYAPWEVDVVIGFEPVALVERQVAVHVVKEMPAFCPTCGGVAYQGGASWGPALSHAWVFLDGLASDVSRVACAASHESGHLFGLGHTPGGLMDPVTPAGATCAWSAAHVRQLNQFFNP